VTWKVIGLQVVPQLLAGVEPRGLPQVASPTVTTCTNGESPLTNCSAAAQVRGPVSTKTRGSDSAFANVSKV